jgi:glycerol uptake facilitator-like aquaporin
MLLFRYDAKPTLPGVSGMQLAGSHLTVAATRGWVACVQQAVGLRAVGSILLVLPAHDRMTLTGHALHLQMIPGNHSVLQGFLGEFAAAFVLIFLVCATALDKKGKPERIPLIMAITVPLLLYTVGPVSSMCINPARALGPAVAANFWQHHWIWWTGPFLGGLAAAIPYKYLSDHENDKIEQE